MRIIFLLGEMICMVMAMTATSIKIWNIFVYNEYPNQTYVVDMRVAYPFLFNLKDNCKNMHLISYKNDLNKKYMFPP